MAHEFFNINIEGYTPLEVTLVQPDDFLKVREHFQELASLQVRTKFYIRVVIYYINKVDIL